MSVSIAPSLCSAAQFIGNNYTHDKSKKYYTKLMLTGIVRGPKFDFENGMFAAGALDDVDEQRTQIDGFTQSH